MSLNINNQFAKKRGIGKKLLLTIRAVTLEVVYTKPDTYSSYGDTTGILPTK